MSQAETNAFCNECGKTTHHKLLSSVDIHGSDHEVSWTDRYQILECGGCKHVAFRKRLWFSEWQSPDPEDTPVFEDTYYPARSSRNRPEWLAELEPQLSTVLNEVYIALQNNLKLLATFGTRTALDIILTDKIADLGSFIRKLDALVESGYVTPEERTMLETAIETGSAAAHRGYVPDDDDIELVLDIVESIIQKLYISPPKVTSMIRKAAELKKRVPCRKNHMEVTSMF